jgi:hypothetical protein
MPVHELQLVLAPEGLKEKKACEDSSSRVRQKACGLAIVAQRRDAVPVNGAGAGAVE